MNLITGFFARQAARRRRDNIIFGMMAGGCCIVFAVVTIVIGIVTSISNTIETNTVRNLYGETVASTCQTVLETDANLSNLPDVSTPRNILLLATGTQRRHQWHAQLPEQWQASNEAEVALIGCVQTEDIIIETCEYERPSSDGDGTFTVRVERVQSEVTLVLVNPETARVIDRITVNGSEPDTCPDDEAVTGSRTLSGEDVALTDISGWLETYIFD